jgi:hypothetical protein
MNSRGIMTETNPKKSDVHTRPQSESHTKDRLPLRIRLLLSVAFGCFVAIFAGVALAESTELSLRIQAGGMGVACLLGVIGMWLPLGE